MNFDIAQAQFGFRPPVTKPTHKVLQELTEEGMRVLVSKHYDKLRQSDIANLFPTSDEGFELAKKHSSDFFIQICGGYPYFNESRGAPRMAGRHQPFRIDAHARQVWLELYIPLLKELKEEGISEESIKSLWDYLNIFSLWMINTQ
ncbi:globin [Sulfurimonas sp.]|nr:globin [Sulfurimonas sp.]